MDACADAWAKAADGARRKVKHRSRRRLRMIYPFVECTRDGNARPTSRTNEDSETRVKSRRLYTPARERRQMDETQTPNTKSQTPNSKSRTRTGAGVPKFQFDVAF